jgi:hypothetical protein
MALACGLLPASDRGIPGLVQASGQTMKTASIATSSVGAYTYIHTYMYIYVYSALLYIQRVCVYMLCMHKRKMYLCQNHKINTLIAQTALWHCAEHIPYTCIFENELFPTTAVQQRQHVDLMGCSTCLAGWSACLTSCKFIVGATRIIVGCIAPTCTPPPLATGHVRSQSSQCEICGG